MKISQQIVAEIVRDIKGRRGIGNEFEQIDPDIQAEIIEKWEGIVTKRFALLIEDKTERNCRGNP